MPDAVYPLLVLPTPTAADRDPGRRVRPSVRVPSIDRQRARLAPRFATLNQAFDARRLTLQRVAPNENPELVLVLETVGPVENFARAVSRVPGLEWLVEWDEDGIEPDDDFFVEDRPDKSLSGRLFLLATNREALDQLLSLWNRYQADPRARFDHGLAKFKSVFSYLKDIRPWSVSDRVGSDVRQYWQDRLDEGGDLVRFEIEAWFFADPQKNQAARLEIATRIEVLGGRVLSHALIPEIAYHGILVELPRAALLSILGGGTPELILSDRIMFFRPKAQSLAVAPTDTDLVMHDGGAGSSERPPIVALLDGLPLQNHPLLAGRLEIDDPDNWEPVYEAKDRVHGTAMASLILHGELDAAGAPLTRRLHVRPILRPDLSDTFNARRREHTPTDVLLIDLVHRAVRRICEGEAGSPAAAPTVRVINISVGDEARVFDGEISPWARLLDWLAFKHKVLFIISAGNDPTPLKLDVPRDAFAALSLEDRRDNVLAVLLGDSIGRRLLAPAESINALTVGALHFDQSASVAMGDRLDVFESGGISPISRVGLGYRRSVKPDVLMPGGRILQRVQLAGNPSETVLDAVGAATAPGHKVAFPPLPGSALNTAAYCRGTSNAAALTSRAAAEAFEVVESLREGASDALPPTRDAVLLKALIAHGASWRGLGTSLLSKRPDLTEHSARKDFVTRWVGYGPVDVGRVLECASERVTLIGTGDASLDEAQVFSVPLPPSLAGKTVWRRLTITLAWFSPINSSHSAYRHAKLWVTPPQTELLVSRSNSVHDKAAQRGTLQHEILEGASAVAFVDGTRFECKVNCAAGAGAFSEKVPFALCVTLEVAAESGINIYEEVRARVVTPIEIQPIAG